MDTKEMKNLVESTNNILIDYQYDLSRFIKRNKNAFSFSPIGDKYDIWWRINYLKMNGYDTKQLEEEVSRIDRDFDVYKEKNKNEYFAGVYMDYKSLVDHYDPDDILLDSYEFENVIYERTNIENLSKELGGKFDTRADVEKVSEMDYILKDRIGISLTTTTYHPVDRPYAPKEYWWLHLEDLYGPPKLVAD